MPLILAALIFLSGCAGRTIIAGPEFLDPVTSEPRQDFQVSYENPNAFVPGTTDTKYYSCKGKPSADITDDAERMSMSYCEKDAMEYHDSETGYVSSMAAPMMSGAATVGTGYLMRNIGRSNDTTSNTNSNSAEGGAGGDADATGGAGGAGGAGGLPLEFDSLEKVCRASGGTYRFTPSSENLGGTFYTCIKGR